MQDLRGEFLQCSPLLGFLSLKRGIDIGDVCSLGITQLIFFGFLNFYLKSNSSIFHSSMVVIHPLSSPPISEPNKGTHILARAEPRCPVPGIL